MNKLLKVEVSPDIKAKVFLEVVAKMSEFLGVSLSHEDIHGGFIVTDYDESKIEWLKDASIEVSGGRR